MRGRGAKARLAALGAALLAAALVVGCSKQANGSAPVATSAAPPAPIISTTIAFVGCASDGQVGPEGPPTGAPQTVQMTTAQASQLAYYAMVNGPGVVGPRGWFCAGIEGSNGETLVIAPQPIHPSDLSGSWSKAAGDAIEARSASGDTSGRFEVAQVIARVFPAHQAFAQGVINEGLEPASSFPSGPFPGDGLTRKSNEVVEFQTPANAVGLGTDSDLNDRLAPGGDPISGVVILTGQAPDLAELGVRLPANLQSLAPAIVQQFELDNPPTGGAPTTPPAAADQGETPPAGGDSSALAVVKDFYQALGAGNGAQASADMIPVKRSGNYAPNALSRFYGSMSQPLQLISATASGDTVGVRYTFTNPNGRVCNGAANVFTTNSGGTQLISRVEALNGC